MRKFLFAILTVTTAASLFACSPSSKDGTDGSLAAPPIVVNLSTPTSNNTTAAPATSNQLKDRYQLQMVMTESNDAAWSFSSKLLIRYTNNTSEPIYSLKFAVSDAITISGVTVNSIATNYSFDKESSTLTVPTGAELAPNHSLSLYVNYKASNVSNLSDAVLRLYDVSVPFTHTVSVTVSDEHSVSSSLGTPEVTSSTNKTFTFSSVSDNNFTLTLD